MYNNGIQNKTTGIYLANVISIDDEYDGCRIKARIMGEDNNKADSKIPYAFPLLPKHLQVKPKVNECVLIFVADANKPNGLRFYIGPVISQPQYLYKDNFELGATTLLPGSPKTPSAAMSNDANCNGVLPNDDDVAILGRKNSDIILSNDDIRIRCGVKSVNKHNPQKIEFNKLTPSFIKLKLHDNQIGKDSYSSATVVADEINLLSNNGSPSFNLYDTTEQITDEEMKKIVESAHPLPYGDKLVNFLVLFLQMFKSHTHNYSNLPPVVDKYAENLDAAFGSTGGIKKSENYVINNNGASKTEIVEKTFSGLADKLLSKNVRIN